MGDTALGPAARLVRELRAQGLSAEIDYDPMKIKKALGIANKLQARFAIIIGEGELASGKYQVKDMASGEQRALESGAIAEYLGAEVLNLIVKIRNLTSEDAACAETFHHSYS